MQYSAITFLVLLATAIAAPVVEIKVSELPRCFNATIVTWHKQREAAADTSKYYDGALREMEKRLNCADVQCYGPGNCVTAGCSSCDYFGGPLPGRCHLG